MPWEHEIVGSNPTTLTNVMRWVLCWYGKATVNRRDAGSIPAIAAVLLTIRMFAWREEIRLQSKRRLRDRQRQNTNRILNHGVHGDHGGNRRKNTVSMKSGNQSFSPVIEPLVLHTTNS